ncbi:hypothetical protein B0E45_29750 [Sinorhizobium sp. A49]|uniref:AGE family epimerase/isomerase n=1 Tax=Sinorhizobium sp. A49 TaxID=1945861 RepID=UPI000987B24D|nr:AGE family epimerase/isomerase [Sinorhizobium sp. A49]OOG63081.1 hypothetical protein B0E45_29750 [Sinorhizobium sp. A49]
MMHAISDTLLAETRRAADWLSGLALPLWSSVGFDHIRGCFHEQLDFALQPSGDAPARVMVQARQIAVFSAAALSGRFTAGRELALVAAEHMIARYEAADGGSGFVFSLGPEHGKLDPLRDLYAHAFVLFALAWVIRLEARPSFEMAVERTLVFLDAHMTDPTHGGFWDSVPRTDNLRRQNPHMHLFEAFIALFETTGDPRFLQRGRALRDLAICRFLPPRGGVLREYFNEDWSVSPAPGKGVAEPGHLFEWSWLLARYQEFSGQDQTSPIGRLMATAIEHGLDPRNGRIVDQINEMGDVLSRTSRSWPHAEALKALTAVKPSLHFASADSLITAVLRRVRTLYCPESLKGGWQDQLDADDRPVRPNIPASTLYHLYFGIAAVEDAVNASLPRSCDGVA